MVFDLYVMNGVVSRWDADDISYFIESIMDNDSTELSDDIFAKVWDYFCFGDSNSAYAGVRYTAYGGSIVYDRIGIYLYHSDDLPNPCQDYGKMCDGYSTAGRDFVILNSTNESLDYVLGQGFAHEFQHVCFAANWNNMNYGYNHINETLSTLAEYMVNSWRRKEWDHSYDDSFYWPSANSDPQDFCQPNDYVIPKIWMIYLYDHFIGSLEDITDDLVYNWLRDPQLSMEGLANALAAPEYSWLGGSTGAERLRNLVQFFAVAKFTDAPDFETNDRFGFEDFDPVGRVGLFLDNCDWFAPGAVPAEPVDCPGAPWDTLPGGCWNVRMIPPSYILDSSNEQIMTTVSGIYTDDDGSHDYIDVPTYGADYIIFKAHSYFQDGGEHEFHFSMNGGYGVQGIYPEVKVWVIGYNSVEDALQLHPEDLVFIEPVNVELTATNPDSFRCDAVVSDFGRGVKSIVIVVAGIEKTPWNIGAFALYSEYEYEYGVFTHANETVTWNGNALITGDVTIPQNATLIIDAGTDVKFWPIDLGTSGLNTTKIELVIDGNLQVNGASVDSVTFFGWNSNTDTTWAGILIDNVSGVATASFNYCKIKNAISGITARENVEITNCTIEKCDGIGLDITFADSVFVGNTTVVDCDIGLMVDGGAKLRLSGSAIKDCTTYGVSAVAAAIFYTDDTEFRNNDIGLYISSGDSSIVTATVANCNFKQNNTGIYTTYLTGTSEINVWACVIDSNATNGVVCQDGGNILLRNNIISNSAVGVFAYNCDTNIRRGNRIRYNGDGVKCEYYADAVIESTEVYLNEVGVLVIDNSNPDLGHQNGGSSNGINKIHHNVPYHVKNLTSLTVMAENNWWRGTQPPSAKFVGNVDYVPYISYEPDIHFEEGPEAAGRFEPQPRARLPRFYTLSNGFPNPFNPITTIKYSVPRPGGHIQITVYNVKGQVVKKLVAYEAPPGSYSVLWDGRSENGNTVASGVYFVEMRAKNFTSTKKLVLLK